jgi:hypothetical protein
MQTQTPPTTKKAPRYSVMKNDSLGFVKVNKTMVQVFLFPLKNKFFSGEKSLLQLQDPLITASPELQKKEPARSVRPPTHLYNQGQHSSGAVP